MKNIKIVMAITVIAITISKILILQTGFQHITHLRLTKIQDVISFLQVRAPAIS